MQLSEPRPGTIRGALRAAACTLLAAGAATVPSNARAGAGDRWNIETATLIYGEKGGTTIFEPIFRVSRLYSNGQRLSAKLGFDTMTGASATGAMPSTRPQTYTTPSGNQQTTPAGKIPTRGFRDNRFSTDLAWEAPVGRLVKTNLGGHVSSETDYRSFGVNGTVSVELFQRLTTVSLGGGVNHDTVDPVGGTPQALGTGREDKGTHPKRVIDGMAGITRVLTRRWLVGLNVGATKEDGYLTEPYKVVSVVDPESGEQVTTIAEKRPGTRERTSILSSSVYHFERDVVYLSHRYYHDTWGVRSQTIDGRYRLELTEGRYLQPHVRYYAQTAADFYTFGLHSGDDLPESASSDYRLGDMRSATVGLKYGFPLAALPGEFSVRGEYIRQWGEQHPAGAVGVQRDLDLYPTYNIGTLQLGYAVGF